MNLLILPLLLSSLTAPNVVLITVDTLRADHLGIYGFERNTSPNIDRLAAQSLVFTDMLCEQPQTGPSLIAMHASRLPRLTGAIRNGVPMPNGTPTAAMLFNVAGYETAAIVSNWNLKPNLSNLQQGFDHYDSDFGKGRFGKERHEMTADVVTDRAMKWLEARDTAKPMFFWVHYMDPHAPYLSKRGFEEQLGHQRDGGKRTDPAAERYQTEVAFVDQQIKRLLDALPKEDTYIVFTADHGEGLGEHGEWGHSRYLYQTTMHVPLFIHGPGVELGRSAAPVRGIDLAPTLLGLAGIAPAASMAGMDLRKALPENDTPRVVETYGGEVPEGEDVREALATRSPQRQSIIQAGWKLIASEGGSVELYNLLEDPAEAHNLADQFPEKRDELLRQIQAWHEQTPRNQSTAKDLSEADLQRLEANGYL